MTTTRKYFAVLGLVILFVATASWLLITRRPPALRDEFLGYGSRVLNESTFDAEAFLHRLERDSVQTENIPDVTYRIARILTARRRRQRPTASKKIPLPGGNLHLLNANDPPGARENLRYWRLRARYNQVTRFILSLGEENFGEVRAALRYLLLSGEVVPYPDLLFSTASMELTGSEIPVINKPVPMPRETQRALRVLFTGDRLITWLKSKRTLLKQFAGDTNTVIGVYDWIAYPEYRDQTGYADFPKTADAYYDLGGGFATPDIQRLIGHEFISLDLVPPQEARTLEMPFHVVEKWTSGRMGIAQARVQTSAEREKYLAQLDRQKWQRFDVFEDTFPRNADSYFITSFGFLSSTVISLSGSALNQVPQLPGPDRTTYMAVRRIVELVALGKDVTLFAYQRASERKYRYRTVFMHFKSGRLVQSKFWPPKDERAASMSGDAEPVVSRR